MSERRKVDLETIQKSGVVVVIPAYKASKTIKRVIQDIPSFVNRIIIVDDCCPENTGSLASQLKNPRVEVLYHPINLGVGGAMKTAYNKALESDCDYFVKMDADGQMDVNQIIRLLEPLENGEADYSKGNRFWNINDFKNMPSGRIFGNLILTFFAKASTGYWNLSDPNNGFTAISRNVLAQIPIEKLHNRYFFESDILFQLYLLGSAVANVPMQAIYGEERSNMNITKVIFTFPLLHIRNTFRRIFYSYYLREFSVASIQLPIGIALLFYSGFQASMNYFYKTRLGLSTPPGTLILIAMSSLSGLQLFLSFVSSDITNVPKRAIGKYLK